MALSSDKAAEVQKKTGESSKVQKKTGESSKVTEGDWQT